MTTTSEKDVSKKSAEMKMNSNVETKKEEKKKEFTPIICYGNDGTKFEQLETEDTDDFYDRVRSYYN